MNELLQNCLMMKTITKLLTKLVLAFLFFLPSAYLHSQNSVIKIQNAYWNLYEFNIQSGYTSFYGDLSSFDNDFYQKMVHESGPAAGVTLTKHFGRLIGISGQLLFGKLHGVKNAISFDSKLFEYNLHLKFNVFNLVKPDNKGNFGINVQTGIGQFLFNSTKLTYLEGEIKELSHGSRVPEFVYFVGGGMFYRSKTNFGITLDVGIRQCENDWLDVTFLNGNFDYYTYVSVGFSYYLQNLKITPIKNKARIAYNDRRLRGLRN